jgi:beta-lactamase regulating signal transducer with metallopeptidase domain
MRAIVEYGLANAATATALAVLAYVFGTLIRRPAVRNALWVIVFVRLLLPPIWNVDLPLPAATSTSDVDNAELALNFPEGLSPVPSLAGETSIADEEGNPAEQVPDGAALDISPPAIDPPPSAATPSESTWRLPDEAFAGFVAIWLAGTSFVLVRSARNVIRFRRALLDSSPAPADIRRQAEHLARTIGLRRCPEILLVPGRVWPSLWMPGLRPQRARLILPAGLLPLLNDKQLAAVLAHELAHLRRGDPWVRWLELIACGIYWWHPLLGWFRRKLRESEEECCDLRVVAATGGRKPYATALVETTVYLNGPDRTPATMLASGAGPVRNLQGRVTMIMRTSRPARLTRLGLATVLGVGGLSLAFGPALAQDRRDPPREERRSDPGPKDRPDGPPRERDRDRGGNKEIDEARAAVEKARMMAKEAMMHLQEAEARLAKLEGRPFPPGGGRNFGEEPRRGPDDRRGGAERAPDNRRPGDRGAPDAPRVPRGPADRGPDGPPMGPGPRGPGATPGRGPAGGELQELHQQIEELRRAMEEMRREIRRNNDGRGQDRPKDGPKEPRRGDGERPKDRSPERTENPDSPRR